MRLNGYFAVDSVGLSGGIALLWIEEGHVRVINYTQWHISALVQEVNNGTTWKFTGFYGHSDTAKRYSSRDLLRQLKSPNSMTWLCAGDFDEILRQKEKVGASTRPYKQIKAFRQAVEICGLNDIQSQ